MGEPANDNLDREQRVEIVEFISWLDLAKNYADLVLTGANGWAAITRLGFTWNIVVGRQGSDYEHHWSYPTQEEAKTALDAWGDVMFVGEPTGWHRHPATGRVRLNGDPGQERQGPDLG
jgi:hypothetical protein